MSKQFTCDSCGRTLNQESTFTTGYGKNHRAFFEAEDKRHAARCAFMGHPVTVCVR